jgi:CubicO group peptidase (beta-lactamase class C family)
MRNSLFVALLQSSAAAAAGFCPFLGPVFPAPKTLSTDPSFRAALAQLETSIQDAFTSGNTSHGVVRSNDTYSIQIFSATDKAPLFDFHRNGINVAGNKTVDGNSIYRIASTTKAITVYLLLLQAGDGIFNDPVTKYLPELTGKGSWDDITVGALAGYMGGIVSDGELHLQCIPIM